MIRLLSKDKEHDVLTIDATPTQISGISEFQLVKLWELLPKAEKAIERAETVTGITKKKIHGTACRRERWKNRHQVCMN